MSEQPWKPDWSLPPEPEGDDEAAVEAFYVSYVGETVARVQPWRGLADWQRESWRREYRDEKGE